MLAAREAALTAVAGCIRRRRSSQRAFSASPSERALSFSFSQRMFSGS